MKTPLLGVKSLRLTMFKGIILFVLSFLLMGGLGVNLPLHVRLFIHYLGNSGGAVDNNFFTQEEREYIQKICHSQGLVQVGTYNDYPEKWVVVSTYEMDNWINESLGHFSCSTKSDGAYDLYDFDYALEGTGRKAGWQIPLEIAKCYIDPPKIIFGLPINMQDASNWGRCLVTKGYGTPFKVHIDFDPLPAPRGNPPPNEL